MTDKVAESCVVSNKTREGNYVFPLYLYDDVMGIPQQKRANFKPPIIELIKAIVGDFNPEQLFEYIYAVLYSPTYRELYSEFLKSDFPRIPLPKNKDIFIEMSNKGKLLCELHLMKSHKLDTLITSYPITGDHSVDRIIWQDVGGESQYGRVYINTTQYFDNVPREAYEFTIGGYQPAEKWLKDRKGRMLNANELRHWQRIIVALVETGKFMDEISEIDFLPK